MKILQKIKTMDTKTRCKAILEILERTIPQPKTELNYSSEFELLVAVMLSAQCTDKRINAVTPALFAKFPTAQEMAQASVEEIFAFIKSVSYPNSKAQHLSGMAKMLVEKHGGAVPRTAAELVALPGVGRKTANVITSVLFGAEAIAVDTHVFRVAERLGLTTGSKSPLQTERALVELIPAAKLATAHHLFILHGRYVCTARAPKCESCELTAVCRYFQENYSSER